MLSLFAFEFAIFSHVLQENIIVCFAYIYSPFTLILKLKMDSLLFLIKKHNNNKTAGYNDKAYIIYEQKRIRWGMAYTTCSIIYGLINYRTFSKHWGIKINR